jgi:hypothetical protein
MEKEPQNSVIFFNNTETYTETPERFGMQNPKFGGAESGNFS